MSDVWAEIKQVGGWKWQIKLYRGFVYSLSWVTSRNGTRARRVAMRQIKREVSNQERRDRTREEVRP